MINGELIVDNFAGGGGASPGIVCGKAHRKHENSTGADRATTVCVKK